MATQLTSVAGECGPSLGASGAVRGWRARGQGRGLGTAQTPTPPGSGQSAAPSSPSPPLRVGASAGPPGERAELGISILAPTPAGLSLFHSCVLPARPGLLWSPHRQPGTLDPLQPLSLEPHGRTCSRLVQGDTWATPRAAPGSDARPVPATPPPPPDETPQMAGFVITPLGEKPTSQEASGHFSRTG